MNIHKGFIGGGTNLLILSLLQEKDMYGYEIIKELELRSEDVFRFKEGTLYPVLHRLENEDFLGSYMEQGETGRQRKYYKITPKGIKQLSEEKKQWQVFSASLNRVISRDAYGTL